MVICLGGEPLERLTLALIFMLLIVSAFTDLFYLTLRLSLAYLFGYVSYLIILALLARRASREAMKWLDDAEKVMRG